MKRGLAATPAAAPSVGGGKDGWSNPEARPIGSADITKRGIAARTGAGAVVGKLSAPPDIARLG
jgi:hypothetical protein